MIAAMLLLLSLQTPDCPEPQAWLDGDRATKAERRDTRARMSRTWKALGLDLEARVVLDVITVRESRGDACAIHVLGVNEFGRGPGGISVGLHLAKWDPQADELELHIPEVSAIVMARLLRRTKARYRPQTWLRFGQIYGGRILPTAYAPNLDNRFCNRLEARGVDCAEPISTLGEKLGTGPTDGQRDFVAGLQEAGSG